MLHDLQYNNSFQLQFFKISMLYEGSEHRKGLEYIFAKQIREGKFQKCFCPSINETFTGIFTNLFIAKMNIIFTPFIDLLEVLTSLNIK